MQDDAAVAYAFCREVDDAVDEAPSTALARAQIDKLDRELRGIDPPRPLVAEYLRLASRAGFGLEPAWDLIEGARSDLGIVRIDDDEELRRYCYRVAGTVGVMMCGILGVRTPEARRHAVDLGIAMQITNICRDVLEDAARGRVYLPRKRLLAQGLDAEALMLAPAGHISEELRAGVSRVVDGMLADADLYYAGGARGYRFIPTRPRLAIMIAARLYRGIGVRLRNVHHSNPLQGRTRVPRLAKMSLTIRALGSWLGQFWRRPTKTKRALQRQIEISAPRQIP